MNHDDFVKSFGAVYEASPWVAEAVWPPPKGRRGGDLAAAMRAAVDAAPRDRKLALIRAHPELAGRTAIAGELAEASKREQSGAGLDRCTPDEFAEFQRLNGAYNARFGFPFIIAVKGLSRGDILAAFRARLDNDPQTEFETALEQIHRIAGLRLADLPEPT